MFTAGNIGSGVVLEGIREVEATWPFEPAAVIAALLSLAADGFAQRREGFGGDVQEYWESTRAGQIAREMRWQQRGRRHPALVSQTASAEDLIIAVIGSGGDERDPLASGGLVEAALGIYLFRLGETVCDATLGALIARGLVRRNDHDLLGWPFRLMLTADGRRQYAHDVIPRLGLRPPATILAPVEPEWPPFEELGLAPAEADTLRFFWDEAARCQGARAWLAATALYGAIIEAVLHAWLGRNQVAAMTAKAAPRDPRRRGEKQPVAEWSLVDLIKVAGELDYIDPSLRRHADALRTSRNLIHPKLQVEQRSRPDENLALISQQVARAVLHLFDRATVTGEMANGGRGRT
ncbi:hypothetical protein B0G75_12055 [Paraburkholderia sp. BL18I3N2]|uniref:hypothetical protein n=1 Tax=Paraburkholderia sp. BL25I1N1 TaxID=1938804 RepID=UPI000D05E698|nr:hypothetical protein [Paraburkholderia sp. BL25I1N1]PRX26098.1 hypothetical protein B0G75_12055 [Paraburkholderia sp. BL18I3N2]PRX95323.1 hypothetical protein B0G73_13316 [Paraburkholderia sp. BL25I1N1]